ncbi:MAG: adenylosuccinate lyase family protein [Bauldia sp.]
MTFSALDSELTGPLFASDAMRAVFSDRQRVAAMLRVEAALAEAEAAHGLVPKGLAIAIRRIRPDDLDIAELGRGTAAAAVPTIPFVKAVEARLPENLRGHLHRGATSQDIVDTALVLQMAAAFDLIAADLAATLNGLAGLTRRHRRTPQVGRTYGQHAAPITFGYTAALWLAGIADAARALPALRQRVLVASLDGPVGTLAGLGDRADAVRRSFAGELGLGVAPAPWHTLRARPAEAGAWLAGLIGALAKLATDVVHLTATEIGEVAEPHESGRGGSSAMPHKQNPVSATVILAAHGAAPGLAATLFASMAAAGERPAGAWQAEWHALTQLFGLASGALREARRLAEGLMVDKARMRANLDMTNGLLFAGAAAARLAPKLGREAAHRLVERAADQVRAGGASLQAVLADDPSIPQRLRAPLAAAFDMTPDIEAAAAVTDRVLADARSVVASIAKGVRQR